MSALTFSLKTDIKQRINCSALTPNQLAGQSPSEIGEIELAVGNAFYPVKTLFAISGDDSAEIHFENSSDKLDFIGQEMTEGKITVTGDVGAYLGLLMDGGNIEVNGNTGILTACEMKSGQIKVNGDAGDQVGGVRVGFKNGMTGGVVIITGNAGDRTGDHMRRGYILIEGNAGDYCASRMVSGTIAVMGDVGAHLGYGMKRGTLLLPTMPSQGLGANFNDCGSHTLAFLPLLFASFSKLDTKFAEIEPFSRVQRYAGDIGGIGMGEVLVKI